MKKNLPIGYYLKKADNLLTEGINEIHREFSIDRTQWQILNSINEGIDKKEIEALLKQFANDEQINNSFSSLIDRNILTDNIDLKLSDKGKALYNQCFEKQKEFRQKAMSHITEQEYKQLIITLEKIIKNLEGTKE